VTERESVVPGVVVNPPRYLRGRSPPLGVDIGSLAEFDDGPTPLGSHLRGRRVLEPVALADLGLDVVGGDGPAVGEAVLRPRIGDVLAVGERRRDRRRPGGRLQPETEAGADDVEVQGPRFGDRVEGPVDAWRRAIRPARASASDVATARLRSWLAQITVPSVTATVRPESARSYSSYPS